MALRVVGVGIEHVDHESGHWCNVCRLGTGFRIWVAVHLGGRMHLQTRLWCSECHGTDITLDPDVAPA